MSDLICVAFKDKDTADRALDELREMQREYLIDLEDACVAVREMDGKVRLGYPWLVIYALKNNTVLEDAFMGNAAGDRSNFELERHRGKVNMVFMDGHAETVSVTARPNLQFPSEVKFGRKVYTVPEQGF